jgi:mannitol 2-dehydrogenase
MNSNTSKGSTIKLNQASLSLLPGNIRIPKYDRPQITNGIVHIGVGGFHRSHQALYLDNYFHQNPGSDWGICGVGLLDYDCDRRMRDALQSQDCLYILVERSPDRDRDRIIG